MPKQDKDDYVSKIDTDDGWNRALYGSPTKGGCLVFILVIIFIFLLMK
jgi:hypothetical protein